MRTLLTSLLCVFTLSFSAQEACPNPYDGDGDGNVSIGDFLEMLAVFGDTDTDFDGVWDSLDACVDLAACNYANDPSEPCAYIDVLGVCGGGCEGDSDNDGICDSEDDCVGVLDECGVSNGPGPTEIVIESITILYDSVYAASIDEWLVFELGADTVFNYFCEPVFNSCGDLVSHEGYDYTTVLIGEQCWFSENCRYLPEVSDPSIDSTTEPHYSVYGYTGTDVTAAQATENYETYGVLYNWPAVMTVVICPSGWHIPTDGEWQTMEISLGMSQSDAADAGWRGTDEGYQMKSTSVWSSGGNGSNSSGFTGLPGGIRYSGGFSGRDSYGIWWSASESGSSSWVRDLDQDYVTVSRYSANRYVGFSARCVIDYTDECGVLNGDNSTCSDECGVPNGDNSTCLDECGVLNGDNSTCSDECGVPYGDNSTCLGCDGVPNSGLVYDECEVCGGDNSTCEDECGVPNGDNSTCFTSCGDDIGHDGYEYSTVLIGDQCWFSENCRYLPVVSSSSAGSDTSPYYYVYGYEGSTVAEAKATANYAIYGVLYNWPAVMTEGICPSGWHIPSDEEFTELTDFLGGLGVAGGKMKEAGYDHWTSPNYGATNSSGWTGLPGWMIDPGNLVSNSYPLGSDGYWWSSSASELYSFQRWMYYDIEDIYRNESNRDRGFSARCVRD
jgi:uncharacterized protein (TIGR02145 family)